MSTAASYPYGAGPVHSDTVVGITRQFVQSACRGAVYVRVVCAAQEADNGRNDAFLAERHPIVTVPAADRDRFGHVDTQQLVCLTFTLTPIISTEMPTYTVSQKSPAFKLSVTLSNLNTDFQNFYTVGKHIKFATKPIRHYPPHLRHVATLPVSYTHLTLRTNREV